MKFDCYPRFLKSEVYKSYLVRELAGELITVAPNATNPDLLVNVNAAKPKSTMKVRWKMRGLDLLLVRGRF